MSANGKFLLKLVSALALTATGFAADGKVEYATVSGIDYYADADDDYQRERCKLDLYYPKDLKNFPTLVWFHGGGLTAGSRYFPAVQGRGIAVVAVDYRLAPRAQYPAYVRDAAAAVAWTLRNIEQYGGDPGKVVVSGYSAGGWLAAMVGMDETWLAAHGLDNKRLGGLAAISGQVTTHFYVKRELGDDGAQFRPVIDKNAPLFHAKKELPPVFLVTGDRRLDMPGRAEENQLLAASLRALGHPDAVCHELSGYDHGSVPAGATPLLVKFVKKLSADIDARRDEK